MRRRLRKLERLINAVNLLNVGIIFVFIIGASITQIKFMQTYAKIGAGLMLFSGVLNLIYWVIWERFNK